MTFFRGRPVRVSDETIYSIWDVTKLTDQNQQKQRLLQLTNHGILTLRAASEHHPEKETSFHTWAKLKTAHVRQTYWVVVTHKNGTKRLFATTESEELAAEINKYIQISSSSVIAHNFKNNNITSRIHDPQESIAQPRRQTLIQNDAILITFESRPFGLRIAPFDRQQKKGAVVEETESSELPIHAHLLSINFKDVSMMNFRLIYLELMNSQLPVTMKFVRPDENATSVSSTGFSEMICKEGEQQEQEQDLLEQQDEVRNRISADIIDEKPDVTFKDVQGLEAVKLALYESIILPALRPDVFTGLRAPSTGLLLFGPPGNGKTMIAKCVAAECDCAFFSISASSITPKLVGDAERIMRVLFEKAREKAPSIIFIDEIDSLLTARGGKNEAESSRRIKTEFLIQFDGVKASTDSSSHVLVIGATNLPEKLGEAVLRRFQIRIMVPLPDEETRGGLIRSLNRKQKHELGDNDFDWVVKASKGYSCSDLANVCKDAAMRPVRDLGAAILDLDAIMGNVNVKHFQSSLKNVKPSSLPPESVLEYDKWNDAFGSKMQLAISALPESMRPRDPNEEPEREMNYEDEGGFSDRSFSCER